MVDSNFLYQDNQYIQIYPHNYVLIRVLPKEQTQKKELDDIITIDLMTSNIERVKMQSTTGQPEQKIAIKAVYGIVQLEKYKYLIVVTKSKLIGSLLFNKKIYQAQKMEFFPITPDHKVRDCDAQYINMLQTLFNTNTFYFSDQYDLTNNLQQFIANETDKNKFHEGYCYNYPLIHDFIKIGAYEWITPFICGYVNFSYCNVPHLGNFILITRRDRRRQGTRFLSRGTDLDGNPSNMAETEQLIEVVKGDEIAIYSFVQSRGSIPFLWSQKPNLKWAPRGQIIGDQQDNTLVFKKHFEEQMHYFPKQILINLIDKKGTQLKLGKYYEELVKDFQNKNLTYIWFDFHHECRKMQWENISKLINQISDELQQQNYYQISYKKNQNYDAPIQVTQHNKQKGICRTNCMDCLDRTNVVQSVIGRQVLLRILFDAGIINKPTGGIFEKLHPNLEKEFRANWTDNANVMSQLYAGTNAQKTDFTRTGKRTIVGAINDGYSGVMRYVNGNFRDGLKQDTYDLLLGKLDVKQKKYKKPKNCMLVLFPFLILAMYMMKSFFNKYVLTMIDNQTEIILPNYVPSWKASISFYFVIIGLLGILLMLLQKMNKVIVSQPKNKF